MPPLRALTLDFWDTMVVARTHGAARRDAREAHLLAVAAAHGQPLTVGPLREALERARLRFDAAWQGEHRTLHPSEFLRYVWDDLALPLDENAHQAAVAAFEESFLAGAPDLTDGLADFVRAVAPHVRLGIISDTMFATGRVLRPWLDTVGLGGCFQAFVFSDETGFSKPDPRAFALALATLDVSADHAAHIGDLLRTDVTGSRNAGMTALHYTGVHTDQSLPITPDLQAPDWDAVYQWVRTRLDRT